MATETKTEMSEEMSKVAEEANSIIDCMELYWGVRHLTQKVYSTLKRILKNPDNLKTFKEKDLMTSFIEELETQYKIYKTELHEWQIKCASEHPPHLYRPHISYYLKGVEEHACFSLHLQGFLRGYSRDIIEAECGKFMRKSLEVQNKAEAEE
jgi:hypothetical protein